jgi:hypothetical protein
MRSSSSAIRTQVTRDARDGNPGAHTEGAIGAPGIPAAAEQGGAFLHADQPVTPGGPQRDLRPHRIGDGW